jgi:signal transduction histidine kinase
VLSRIDERRRHLATIESSREKLLVNERLAAIGQMVAGLAHESRNAFQRSHACLEELQLDLEDNPAALMLIGKVQKALHDLHMLLEEVRNYSAPVILERRACSLESMIQETWQQVLDARKVEHPPAFTVSKTEDYPAACFLDADRIRMVIRNLLENALFACANRGAVDVALAFMNDEKQDFPVIRLTVTDSGSGIPPADMKKVFVPFFTTKTKGTGLGLSVSQRYVDAHGGRIYATHAEKGGACLVVEIPYFKP